MAEKKEKLTMDELNRELRGYIAQIEALRVEISVINQTISDYRAIIKTLNTLKELGKGKNILIPVGSIASIEAKIEDPEKVILDVGAGISAELKLEEALGQIASQIATLEALRRTLEEAIVQAYEKTEELLQKTRELGQEEGKKSKK